MNLIVSSLLYCTGGGGRNDGQESLVASVNKHTSGAMLPMVVLITMQ